MRFTMFCTTHVEGNREATAIMTYRILDVPWHIGHQYEMLKFPFVEWSWLLQYVRPVDWSIRGNLHSLVKWVAYYQPGQYDAAVLHLDQVAIAPPLLTRGKGRLYFELNAVIQDIPKIVIMHGTPYAPESSSSAADIIKAVRQLVGTNYLVVNSQRAAEQWGWGKVIIHGMDPREWFDLPKLPRVVTTMSRSGMAGYYDRPFLQEIKTALARRGILHCQIGADFISRNWDDYRQFLGRSLIYMNPTRESPMPRARTEAMLSGCCVLTTPHHGADKFIRDGINGFLLPREANYVADLVEDLLDNPARAIAVGRAGKETATKMFHWDRYANDWSEFLDFVINDSN
jgi:hypothetical protein